jgi:hypothetical protein
MRCLKYRDTIRQGILLGGESSTKHSTRYRKSRSENSPYKCYSKKCGNHPLEIKGAPSIAYLNINHVYQTP